MAKTIILSNSVCDLSKELIEKYDIRIIPLTVVLNDNQFKDGVDITPDEIYDFYRKNDVLPKTAAANLDEQLEFMNQNVKEGEEAVLFNISSEMSVTHNTARLAAQEANGKIVPIDSRNLSTGIGLLVIEAAKMAEMGATADEIAEKMNELIPKVDASFVVDTLEFLHKGGRCSAVAAFGANLLKLKPEIQVKDGKMGVSKKHRGNLSTVLLEYAKGKLADKDSIAGDTIFVTHSGADEEVINNVANFVKGEFPEKDVFVTRAGCTISSHCGPNTLGVIFIRKNNL